MKRKAVSNLNYLDFQAYVGVTKHNGGFAATNELLSSCHIEDARKVLNVGCGLDSRFERVTERNSQVEWYDLDLPEVIDLRRRFIGDEGEHYHLLACSVLEDTWLEAVKVHSPRHFCFWPKQFSSAS